MRKSLVENLMIFDEIEVSEFRGIYRWIYAVIELSNFINLKNVKVRVKRSATVFQEFMYIMHVKRMFNET